MREIEKFSNLVRRDQLLDLSNGNVSAGDPEELRNPDLEHGEGHQEGDRRGEDTGQVTSYTRETRGNKPHLLRYAGKSVRPFVSC